MTWICETPEDRQYRRGLEITADWDGEPCDCSYAAASAERKVEARFCANKYWRGWQIVCFYCEQLLDELDE